MAVSTAGPPTHKRHKADGGMGAAPDGSMPPNHGHLPPQQRYQQPGYGSGPPGPHMQQNGYMWQGGQYGTHPPPPHSWQGGQPPGPMFSQRGGPPMTPERNGGNWNGYRGPHPAHQPPAAVAKSQARRPKSGSKPNVKPVGGQGANHENGQMAQQQYWNGGNPQWGQPQWGGGPPPQVWQGGHPPPQMHQPPGYGVQNGWTGNANTPPRGGAGRPRASPDMMGNGMMGPRNYAPIPNGPLCAPIGMDTVPPPSDPDMYVSSRGVGRDMDDDTEGSVNGKLSDKDKGRGSYKCGRCGVPKKGHVCPYQPKLRRRSGEPPPQMKSAAIQVEMDEFMTLRRLNIRIQGYPESYAADPRHMPDMVGGEARPMPVGSSMPLQGVRSSVLPVGDGPLMTADKPRSSPLPSPLRASPVIDAPPMNEPEVAK